MNKGVQEMHEQIVLMLNAFHVVGFEPDTTVKHILIITRITLRDKLNLILLHNCCPESVHKYETLKCMAGASM